MKLENVKRLEEKLIRTMEVFHLKKEDIDALNQGTSVFIVPDSLDKNIEIRPERLLSEDDAEQIATDIQRVAEAEYKQRVEGETA